MNSQNNIQTNINPPLNQDPNSNCCAVCLEIAGARAGVPLITPGCCGKWYHADCIQSWISNGANHNCPNCRAPFSEHIMAYARSLQNLPQSPMMQMQQTTHQHRQQNRPPVHAIHQPSPSSFGNRPQIRRNIASILEDVEETVDAWTPTQLSSGSSAQQQPNVVLEIVNEYPEVTMFECKSCFHSVVSLKSVAPVTDDQMDIDKDNTACANMSAARPPMDIVCILDKSGSMDSDNKMENLKFAMGFIRDEMQSADRLGVITFDNSSVVLHNLLKMHPANKARVSDVVNQVPSDGGTSIVSGMRSALHMMENRKTKNPVSCVFLLTDGIDGGDTAEKKKIAQRFKELGIALYVFGFGSDHDSAHLNMIANAAEGTFNFIEESDTVVDAFGGALGAQQSITAVDVCVTILAAPGNIIASVNSGCYRNAINSDHTSASVMYTNLLHGESRDILVKLDLHAVEEETSSFAVLSAFASYKRIEMANSSEAIKTETVDSVVKRMYCSHENETVSRNVLVDVQMNRAMLDEATRNALAAADRGDYETARRNIEQTKNFMMASPSMAQSDKYTTSYVAELNRAYENVSDDFNYRSKGGRHQASEMQGNISKQRCTYSKGSASADIYQTTGSRSAQTKAFASKSKY